MARKPVALTAVTSEPAPGSARPTHIVLFKSPSERNAAAVAGIMGAKAAAGHRGLSSARTMLVAGKPQIFAKMYDDLGVAAISATPEDAQALRESPAVEAVFVNERRSIPPMPAATGRAVDGQSGLAGPAGMAGLDYLRGLRDGLDMALDTFEGRAPRPPQFIGVEARPKPAFDETVLTWGLQAIGIAAGYPFTGKGIKVAVLDTGIDLTHPDLKSRFKEDVNTRSFVQGERVQDGHGHGTHCIGTVGGPLTSQFGPRYGVAPDTLLLAGKVLNNAGSGFDDGIIDGIQWAIDNGAHVISMSLGSVRAQGGTFSVLYERLAERAMEGSPGTLIVAAAGNESERPRFTRPVGNPAACPSIMAVAAVDRAMRVAWFSCRALDGIGKLEVTGPGVDILSAGPGGTQRMNGTSMATPHVSGVAALYFEAVPGTGARAVWDRLVNEARSLGDPADFGSGLVQVPKAGPVA